MDSVSGACGSDTCRLGRLDERVAVFGVSAGWRILALVLLALIVTDGLGAASKLLSNDMTSQTFAVGLAFDLPVVFDWDFFRGRESNSSSSLISIG